MTTASIIVATYGAESWRQLARERAIPSAQAQGCQVITVHGSPDDYGTLSAARNYGARWAAGEWLIFLDADDELAPGYVEAILAGSGDLRTPMVQRVHKPGLRGGTTVLAEEPAFIPPRDLRRGNYLVIGTALPKALFDHVGGFHEWPLYEDWDLFYRCWLAGAEVGQIPGAIYRAWVREDGRNSQDRELQLKVKREIEVRYRFTRRREPAWRN